jgi:hypothetical protein
MTDSSAFLPHNRRRQELCGPGGGKTNSRSPRWDPSAITGVSSRPPHDVTTPRYAPPRATSPRCYARCSEVSLRDLGIRSRYACSAGRPAPRCCKAPRPHRHPRPVCCWGNAMPTVRITDAPLTIEDLLAVPTARRWNWLRGTHQDRRRPSRGGPGPGCGERRPRPHGPGRPRQAQCRAKRRTRTNRWSGRPSGAPPRSPALSAPGSPGPAGCP